MLDEAWAALQGAPGFLDHLAAHGGPAPLAGPLATGELASATAGVALLAAAELAEARTGTRPEPALPGTHVAVAFASERHVRLAGAAPETAFDPLSAFFAASDGWVRLHGNYPHHRAAVMRALGHPRDGAAGVPAAVAARTAEEVESAVVAAGGAAAAVRGALTWRTSGPGAAIAGRGLLDFAPGVAHTTPPLRPLPDGADAAHPAAGLRVLDLTRVIAGPVATRVLAALGAEVLRVDAPQSAEIPLAWRDGTVGKRSVQLQLRNRPDRERLHRLLDDADVLVTGYRPGALDPFGLTGEVLQEKHPQLCTVTLSAWGDSGPWAGRRGFDSIVQAATGIAELTSPDGGATPGTLPVQALDHGTGYLIAAAALRALVLREREQRASHATVALARTAMWLLRHGEGVPRTAPPPPDPEPYLQALPSPLGEVTVVRPPGTLGGRALGWAAGPPEPGSSTPYWQS